MHPENMDTMENRQRYWQNMQLQPFVSNRAPFHEQGRKQMEAAEKIEDCCDYFGLYLHGMRSSRGRDDWFVQVANVPDGDAPQVTVVFQGEARAVVEAIGQWTLENGYDRRDSMWTELARRLRAGYRGLN